jgi:hypothetical protein
MRLTGSKSLHGKRVTSFKVTSRGVAPVSILLVVYRKLKRWTASNNGKFHEF